MARNRRTRRSWFRVLAGASLAALVLAMAAVLAPTLLLVAALDPCASPTAADEQSHALDLCRADSSVERPGSAAWGGYANGRIPASALCPLAPGSPHRLRCDAAAAFAAMAAAHEAGLGRPLRVTDAYRDLAGQRDVAARKPELAARPGTSVHGWGMAVDLVVGGWNGETFRWLQRNAPRFGWHHPPWAHRNGSKPEPWHWEYLPQG